MGVDIIICAFFIIRKWCIIRGKMHSADLLIALTYIRHPLVSCKPENTWLLARSCRIMTPLIRQPHFRALHHF